MLRDYNPPAFPRDHRHMGHDGMTLLDWFAGQALVGGMANADPQNFATPKQCATMAYQIADAMLAEREKRNAE